MGEQNNNLTKQEQTPGGQTQDGGLLKERRWEKITVGGKQGDNNLTAYLHANDGVYEEQHHYKQSYVGQSLKRGEMHQWQVFCRLILHQSWSPFIFIQISLVQLIFKVTIYYFIFFFLFSNLWKWMDLQSCVAQHQKQSRTNHLTSEWKTSAKYNLFSGLSQEISPNIQHMHQTRAEHCFSILRRISKSAGLCSWLILLLCIEGQGQVMMNKWKS